MSRVLYDWGKSHTNKLCSTYEWGMSICKSGLTCMFGRRGGGKRGGGLLGEVCPPPSWGGGNGVLIWSDWYDWFIHLGHDSFILCHTISGGGLICILTCLVYSVSYNIRCGTWLFRIVSWRRRTYFSQQASASYYMTQYEGVMSHICETVIPIASSTRAPFPAPPWHNMKESCPTSVSQSYQSLHQLEHHFLLIQDTNGLDHVPPRDISLGWIKKRIKVLPYMQTSHLMNWNIIWQSRVLRKGERMIVCYVTTLHHVWTFHNNKEAVKK